MSQQAISAAGPKQSVDDKINLSKLCVELLDIG